MKSSVEADHKFAERFLKLSQAARLFVEAADAVGEAEAPVPILEALSASTEPLYDVLMQAELMLAERPAIREQVDRLKGLERTQETLEAWGR